MADATAHNHDHGHEAPAGQPRNGNPETPVDQAVGAQQERTKGKVRGTLGRIWDSFKSGVRKAFHDVGSGTKKTEQANEEEGQNHDHGHAHDQTEPTSTTEPTPDNDEGAPVGAEGTDLDSSGPEEPTPTVVTPAAAATAETSAATTEGAGGAGNEANHAKDHGHQKEGMSTGAKVALGTAGVATVLGAAAVVGTVHVASEITQTTIEHGPKWLNTAGELIRWPFRAAGKFLGHTLGEPVALAAEGFEYGAEELVGEADYEELTGWTAPVKLAKNAVRGTVRNPITRTVAGLGVGALGFVGGLFKGPIEGFVNAFSSDNAPKWEMPFARTKKDKPKKVKKVKKALKPDSHGSGHGTEHKEEHPKEDHPKPAEAEHKGEHPKEDHPKPAGADHKEEHPKKEEHRFAA